MLSIEKNGNEVTVRGTVTLTISKKMQVEDVREALLKAYEDLNSYSNLTLDLPVKVDDVEVEWTEVEGEE